MMSPTKDIKFSNINRADDLSKKADLHYELIVIGGGVTGAGIALDASLRGIKTLLLEKQDFASGTSSKSTKLIHGGLRYLKQLEFGLVRETGLERAVAHRNAPHLVHPETMLLPIVENGTFSKLSASIAISVYDWMADVPGKDRKKTLDRSQTIEREPLLNKNILKSAIAYSEYRTDDARLTIELIKAARREGAVAFNYAEVDSFISEGGKVKGVNCRDVITDKQYTFSATSIVSAAGPWVDTLRAEDHSLKGKSLHLTKGVHIVVPKDRLPIHRAVYFDAFDGRMIFAIPRGKVTYIGTSDTNYKGDLDRVLCSIEDVEYLLKTVNFMFEVDEIKRADVISSWAGLRPLIHEEGKSPSELSRKDEIFISSSDLISIAGGKLTGYRKMGQRIVDLLQKRYPQLGKSKSKTSKYSIHADSFKDYDAFVKYYQQLAVAYKEHGLSLHYSWYLTSTYGKFSRQIIEQAIGYKLADMKQALIKAEIAYTIDYEAAIYPDDYFNRRSGKLYFDVDTLMEHFDFILNEFQAHYHWDEAQKQAQIHHCKQLVEDVTIFRNEQ